MAERVKTIAVLTARTGKAEELHALLDDMVAPSRGEPGNLRYDLWIDRAEASRFVLDELYIDTAALEVHRASAHFQTYLSRIDALADRSVFGLDPLAVA